MAYSLRSMVPVCFFLTIIAIGNASKSSKADDPGCPTQLTPFYNGFMTGVECSQLGQLQLKFLIIGFVNGFLVSPFVGASASCLTPYQQCLAGKSDIQLGAYFSKWLRDRPERWDQPCDVLLYSSLKDMCTDLGFIKQ